MNNIFIKLECSAILVISLIMQYINSVPSQFKALLIFIVIDYITGITLSIFKKKLSSKVGAKGIAKKAMIVLLVGLGYVVDTYIIGNNFAVSTMLIAFYISNEGISIIENMAELGLPIPDKIIKILAQVKDEK